MLAQVERDAVLQAREPFYEDDFAESESRHSWQEIGAALGISRQAAWKKFRNLEKHTEKR
jgi:hypothetical protein